MITIHITLNGTSREIVCSPGDTLLTVLRHEGLASVRFGSETGESGAAAVLLDGRLASADVLLAAKADGHDIMTVEGLDVARGELHPVQAALVETGAVQSGYSAGAMVLAAVALLQRQANPSEAEIRDAFSGVLDRESGYVKLVEAVKRAAAVLRGEKPDAFEPLVVRPLSAAMSEGGEEADARSEIEPLSAPDAVPRVVSAPDVPPMAVVARPTPKVDALALVKGKPVFTDDVEPRNLLYAKVLRSPHAHARIIDIDDREARALPGVHAIVHYKNTPRVKYATGGQSAPNPYPWDQVSFDDKVRHVGDRVAAVAAESLEIAEEACRRVKVTYEVLSAVFNPESAKSAGAPIVHDEDDSLGILDNTTNVSSHVEGRTIKDMPAALAKADHIFEGTFRVQRQAHCAIEPHVTVGWIDEDDRLVIRTSTQVPFHVRRMLAPLLGLTVKDIRVIKPRIGGGFGGKQEMLIEDIVGHLVLASRRPVRLELTREEEFSASRTRHAQTLRIRTGVTSDGQLLAQDLEVVSDTGPFGVHGFTVSSMTGMRALSSYNCPAKQFNCDVVYTNGPVAGAMRGYGAPQGVFALESHLDDIARALNLDPIEFRRRNWVGLGDRLDMPPRLNERGGVDDVNEEDLPQVASCGSEECLAQALRAIGWERRQDPEWTTPPEHPEIRRGIGLGFSVMGSGIPGVDMGAASIKINDDGSFNLLIGATDLGTGADTVVAQIAAEVLGVPLEDILVYEADTDLTPFDVGAYASGTTYISGMAAKKAATVVARRIAERAAEIFGLDSADSVVLRDRQVWAPDGRAIPMDEIAMRAFHFEQQEQIIGVASHLAETSPSPFAVQLAEVEVDVGTGQVTVKKFVSAVDGGVAVNPLTASGQIEGAVLQGLGYALTEEIVLDAAGRVVNPRFGPYWIPRCDDAPASEVFLVQTFEPSGPYGAKAIGEIGVVGVAPAVRNAILDATGVPLYETPFTPERVWRALNQAGDMAPGAR
ncbi:MAG: molybdopterin cofactor-binding domain-containing protein [Acidimicrobiales bacterium]|jgi:putative selenate reductase molybdopterin-binding subunit